jgi:hypothetical protein
MALTLSDVIYNLEIELTHLDECMKDSKEKHIKNNLFSRYCNLRKYIKDLQKLQSKLSSLSNLV